MNQTVSLKTIRSNIHRFRANVEPSRRGCERIARWIYNHYGWIMVDGTVSMDDPPRNGHVWNILPNGSFIDGGNHTVDDDDQIYIPPTYDRYRQYVPYSLMNEFSTDYFDESVRIIRCDDSKRSPSIKTIVVEYDRSDRHRSGVNNHGKREAKKK